MDANIRKIPRVRPTEGAIASQFASKAAIAQRLDSFDAHGWREAALRCAEAEESLLAAQGEDDEDLNKSDRLYSLLEDETEQEELLADNSPTIKIAGLKLSSI